MSPGSPPWTNLRGQHSHPFQRPKATWQTSTSRATPKSLCNQAQAPWGFTTSKAQTHSFSRFLLHQPATLGPDVGSWKQRGRSPACPSSYTPPATDNPAPTPWRPQAGHVTAFPAGLPPTTLATLKLPLHLPVTEDQWYCHQKALNKRQTTWGSDTES